jgi:hypothetical protein
VEAAEEHALVKEKQAKAAVSARMTKICFLTYSLAHFFDQSTALLETADEHLVQPLVM